MARLCIFSLIAALLTAPSAANAAATLVPHVAAYRLSLANRTGMGNPFTEVRGGLVIEWRLACDGWLSRQRLAFVGTLQEGGDLGHDVRFSSWEALDGSRMRYSYRSYDDQELQEEFRGEARLDPPDRGVAAFTEPSQRQVELPPDTIFPTVHIQQVLDKARAGEQFVSHQVFDGAGFDSLTQITSVIGQPQMVESLAEQRDERRRVALEAGVEPVVPGQTRAGQPGLDAAGEPAVAWRAGHLVRLGPRQRIVTPFAGDRIGPGQHR